VYTTKEFYQVMKYFVLEAWKIQDIEFPTVKTPEEVERIDKAKKVRDKLVKKYTRIDPDKRNELAIKKAEGVAFDSSWIKEIAA
jgi:hypothetical protein